VLNSIDGHYGTVQARGVVGPIAHGLRRSGGPSGTARAELISLRVRLSAEYRQHGRKAADQGK
jgi:hypothetical protein